MDTGDSGRASVARSNRQFCVVSSQWNVGSYHESMGSLPKSLVKTYELGKWHGLLSYQLMEFGMKASGP